MNTPSIPGRRGERALSALRSVRLFLMLAAVAVIGTGCGDDDPVQPATGFDVRGIVLRTGTADTVVVDTTSLRGSLQLQESTTSDNIDVLFIKKDGTRAVPGTGYTLSWTVADPTVAELQTNSAWQFKAVGKKAGSTSVTFKLMNGSTTVYTSQAIPVTVAGTGFKMGDTLTYTFYDLDDNNQPVALSQQKKVWAVLRTGLAYKGKNDVTEIMQLSTDASGAVFLSRDTIYVQANTDGSLYQFDLLRTFLHRLQDIDALGEQLPEQWIKISNSKQTTAGTWAAMEVDSLDVQNIDFGGTALNVAFRLDATHQGRVATTVPAGSYPDAVHTNLRLRLNVRLAAFPIPLLFDSLMVRSDVSGRDGILRQVLETKTLRADLGGQAQELPVIGYRMELKSYTRKP